MARLLWRRLQGFTGDGLGATQQVCEIAFLPGLGAGGMPNRPKAGVRHERCSSAAMRSPCRRGCATAPRMFQPIRRPPNTPPRRLTCVLPRGCGGLLTATKM